MSKHITERKKRKILREIQNGTLSVAEAMEKYHIPSSTLYDWTKQGKVITTRDGSFSLREYSDNKRRLERKTKALSIVVNSPFVADTPLKERMDYMKSQLKSEDIDKGILCDAFGVDHITFYHHLHDAIQRKSRGQMRKDVLEMLTMHIYLESGSTYGHKKIAAIIREKYPSLHVSDEYIRRIMRELGIKGAVPKQTKRGANKAYKERLIRENLLKGDFTAERPNEKWLMDAKLLYCKGRRYNLCTIEDLFANKVVAFAFGPSENTNLINHTIRIAINSRKPLPGLILHTDLGAANKSIRTARLLRKNKIIKSFSAAHTPTDDSPEESFFSHFTAEFYGRVCSDPAYAFRSERDMRERVKKFIEFYNNKRPHEKNNYKTPRSKENEYFRHCAKKYSDTNRDVADSL